MQQRVGPYELLRPLGTGGMAETFLAVKRGPADFERRVCLKRILPTRAADARFLEQFLDEARLLAHLHHPGIVGVQDFGEVDGTYYMTLELVDGVDLDTLMTALRMRERPLPDSLAFYIASEILAALHYAHTLTVEGEPLGIVHRDISPSNILISKNGDVKLTDFGIAKFRSRRHRTESGYVKGKIAYMSPEQVRGDELDGRSDLFSLGVVLHEIVTGVHPFDAATDITLLNNILTGTRPGLRTLIPGASSELVVLLDALLTVDCKRRPASAVDALRLVPATAPEFELKRQLTELLATIGSVVLGTAPTTRARSPTEPIASRGRAQELETLPLARAPEVSASLKPAVAASPTAARQRRSRVRAALLAACGLAATIALVDALPTSPNSPPSPAQSPRETVAPPPSARPPSAPESPLRDAPPAAPEPRGDDSRAQPGAPPLAVEDSAPVDAGALDKPRRIRRSASAPLQRRRTLSQRSDPSAGGHEPAPSASPTAPAESSSDAPKKPVGRSGASVSLDDF